MFDKSLLQIVNTFQPFPSSSCWRNASSGWEYKWFLHIYRFSSFYIWPCSLLRCVWFCWFCNLHTKCGCKWACYAYVLKFTHLLRLIKRKLEQRSKEKDQKILFTFFWWNKLCWISVIHISCYTVVIFDNLIDRYNRSLWYKMQNGRTSKRRIEVYNPECEM